MARNTEPHVNSALASVLDGKHPRWRARAEQTGVFMRAPSLQPDILVNLERAAPIAIEAEFAPATRVEDEAIARLGKKLEETGLLIEQTIAVKYDVDLRSSDNLKTVIDSTAMEWCVLSGDSDGHTRWPRQGWLRGSVNDLAVVIEHVSLSERLVARGLTVLEEGINQSANLLRREALPNFGEGLDRMAALLHQEEGEQTSRMAMAIVANAVTFHTTLVGRHGIPELDSLRGELGGISRPKLLECWQRILRINYWPIFSIAIELILEIRSRAFRPIMDRLVAAAQELSEIGATSLNDLSGRMFQRLIVDRKFLATFYTLPTSATVLAELAIPELDVDWEDASSIQALRIGDLACGTGALLLATYQGVLGRYRRTGRDDADLHAGMMERALVAADIMPAATHLTASNLSAAHPGVTFEGTRVYTMPYGEQPEGRRHAAAIGSLDLLDEGHIAYALFGTGQTQARGDRADVDDVNVDVQHGSLDLAIMNPPFTRPTNHEATDVPVPSFAGFETAEDEQRAMSKRLSDIGRRTASRAGHGNAGLASHFVDLAHVKTRPGGVVALVLPASFAQGGSWKAARELVATEYESVVVVGIAATGSTSRAFSADTGMAEVLLIGRKVQAGASGDGRALFVNLRRRPRSLLEAAEVARAIRARVASGSPSAGWLNVGDSAVGSYVEDSLADCGAVGVANPDLVGTMRELEVGKLRLPRRADSLEIPVTALGELGTRGPLDRDINGKHPDGAPRGPFDVVPLADAEQPPTYPVLWAHRASRERRLVVEPDRAGRVRNSCDAQAVAVWDASASRLHFNRDFQVNSQSLAACMTPEPVIGGRAWPSFVPEVADWECVLALWANTTLGLMSFWWKGSRQQQGRASMTVSRLPDLPVLDCRRLTSVQLNRAKAIFKEFRNRALLPANEAYRDDVRADLDRAVLVDLLELPESILPSFALLRRQWCAEPSVHGGKSTKPRQTDET